MNQQYDVIIVGGGMVGATLAVALASDTSLKIALIEATPPSALNSTANFELRVSALTHNSETLLKNLAIWPQLNTERIAAFTDMHVWEHIDSPLHFDSADLGESHLGHIVENKNLQIAALTRCQQLTNIQIINDTKPSEYKANELQLDNGDMLTARLIIAADGAHSSLREWAGIQQRGWAYRQQGLVCNVTTEQSHQFTARQRFVEGGILAFLPLADPNQCAIVWSVNKDKADTLSAMPDEAFINELNQAIEQTLGDITHISDRAAFPLQLKHAESYIKQGLALVGDAAHTIHPLAGQGVNIGLLDAATLAETILEAQLNGRDIGSLHTLQKYQRQRRADNHLMQYGMDAMKHIFAVHQLPPLKWLRQTGFSMINKQSWLKNIMIKQASSRHFSQPSLINPETLNLHR